MTAELADLQSALYTRIATELSLQVGQVQRTLTLLLDDATVPFIARYRKEATGNLDEEYIRQIAARYKYYQELEQRRTTILKTIEAQGKLTETLRQHIVDCMNKVELEDLYLPYRPKRQTKASVAMERGLEPLARLLWEQQASASDLGELAASLVAPDKGVPSVEEAFTGAGHILAEWIAEHADIRKALRHMLLTEGQLRSTVVEGKQTEKTKFQDYYDFREPVATIPSHRILAVLRGEREGMLTVGMDVDPAKVLAAVHSHVIQHADSPCVPYLNTAIEDAVQRLLCPSLQTEVRRTLKERADMEAIGVFQENLQNLLMAPPLGSYNVIGLDPGLRTGCKVALVDDTGKYLEHATIYPLVPHLDTAGAERVLQEILQRYTVKAIAIGNGTGSREAELFVRQFLKNHRHQDCLCVVVNESGASVYSASKVARQEFPELDVTVRGAISIARRLQDPLAELVKIDPKAIGVGQYQHDVDQRHLRRSLEETVESCVNRVGVDLNTASVELLRYVSGLNVRQAQNLVEHRHNHGRLMNRQQLLQIEGLGEKTFQQAAGFLRVKDGESVLDNTAVHPEAYVVVERMAASLQLPVASLVANTDLLNRIDLQSFVDDHIGLLTLQDVREELLKPGRDPRAQFVRPRFRDDVTTLADLQADMILEGVVSNVTNFGAFVDVGVHQDGLVHISELSTRYIRDPREVVHVGQIVQVKVLNVDTALQRISLTMKGVHAASTPSPRPPEARPPEARQAEARQAEPRSPAARRPEQRQPPQQRVAGEARRRRRRSAPQQVAEPSVAATVMAEKLRELQAHFHNPGRD